MIKLVYIAGPFRATKGYDMALNVVNAAKVCIEIWNHWALPVCPHMNSGPLYGVANEDFVMDAYLEQLRRCDAALFLDRWMGSSGSVREFNLATELNMPVFFTEGGPQNTIPQELLDWLDLEAGNVDTESHCDGNCSGDCTKKSE